MDGRNTICKPDDGWGHGMWWIGGWIGVRGSSHVCSYDESRVCHRYSNDGAAGLCLATAAAVLPAACLTDITSNNVLMTGFWAWLIAQTLKVCCVCFCHVSHHVPNYHVPHHMPPLCFLFTRRSSPSVCARGCGTSWHCLILVGCPPATLHCAWYGVFLPLYCFCSFLL